MSGGSFFNVDSGVLTDKNSFIGHIKNNLLDLENEDVMPASHNYLLARLVKWRNESNDSIQSVARRVVFAVGYLMIMKATLYEVAFNLLLGLTAMFTSYLNAETQYTDHYATTSIKYLSAACNGVALALLSTLVYAENFFMKELKLDGSVSRSTFLLVDSDK